MRIIGGRLRGRRLPVPDQPGLRPTTDRVRETLFNWLAPDIAGSRCLDCFAGSGALGFEAFSRGAAAVVLIERAAAVAARLRENAALLRVAADAPGGQPDVKLDVMRADALGWLEKTDPRPFDIVFLDPPFDQRLIGRACELLQRGWLAPKALIYLESAASEPPPLPAGWRVTREGTAGQVRYALAVAEHG
ncbi:MAG: 16S rRNA (guanine(966)-N(2))-methyltransferase RsmD [Thiohalocapsa sp.]|uniref:16S rRNA (guanine(966)-N(2))-methyltransferase RsmD n=1 Tax=Thiohalocapsa sp. TaxID=2497641 RepID=UPI0025D37468|nr:16S rRNA (guanine(966)-N(2))-methyltransferase RsmD [Thiohalocapsa sp.]MCG6942324.1 16S rRNA (guanine(966)-N(2))-methyltransferase RsmD [Thiohalocapsa sp.]